MKNTNLYNLRKDPVRDLFLPPLLRNNPGLFRIKNKENQNHIKQIKGGYLSYELLIYIENASSEESFLPNLVTELAEMLKNLEKNKIYSILPFVVNNESQTGNVIVEHAIFIHFETSPSDLANYFLHRLLIHEAKYFDSPYGLAITGRIWYTKDQLINTEKYKEIINKVDEILINKNKIFTCPDKNQDESNYFLKKIAKFKSLKFNSIAFKLTPEKINKLEILEKDNITNKLIYKLDNSLIGNNSNSALLSVSSNVIFNKDNTIIKEYNIIQDRTITHNWRDIITKDGIIRKLDGILIKFNNSNTNILYTELFYNFRRMVESNRDYNFDDKIAAIDLETYTINLEGEQKVFACGWIANNETHIYYLGENACYNSHDLIYNLFNDIFNSSYSDYTFYVHNLSKFDSIFIMDSLSRKDFQVIPIIKEDNSLVSLNIKKKISIKNSKGKLISQYKTIKLLDSNLILNGSLRMLSKIFNSKVEKGYFPYKFISENTLNYKGNVPHIKFFDNITINEYNKLFPVNTEYSVRTETKKYLNSDLLSLNEIMIKFAKMIFNDFNLNITKYKTISSLSLQIFLSNYYNLNSNITIIKGNVEEEIRKSYFGGLVHLPNRGVKINNAFQYDVNSMYPSVMLKKMPVGNPRLSDDLNLNNYFGFCYAIITPPTNLDVYLIPFKNDKGKIIYPSKPFKGIYFSELLKASLNYGYEIEIIGGFKFDSCENVFKNFVMDIYNKRIEQQNLKEKNLIVNNSSNLKNPLELTYKLILNSLYGRMGMKNIESKVAIVDEAKAKKLLSNKNILQFAYLNDKVLIKYNNKINNDLLKMVDRNTSSYIVNDNNKINTLIGKTKIKGITSSIAIASAITAYAQIELMKFKNIPDNKLIYSDTDSFIFNYPLPDEFVSQKELGKLKLEHVIEEGYFIAPKLYAIKNNKGEEILKHKGIRKNLLKYEDFINLYNGDNITVKNLIFTKNLKKGTIKIQEIDYTINGKTLNT